ncbi:hypothetical protein CROQUDRAFT_705626 [Cronartium quercuum f. sp. fusiforme G11]|uniref:Uncharacterized protein n=1 Tax=Cronartium quercuum f. sp. fusiforme G11 TaxID=708437 RepID=A0A9P6N7U9_9BASI|nr:hypothetical protein CROQUDRAFT_705626 [Cronartium quercuum f. sp. fusiforme G11]
MLNPETVAVSIMKELFRVYMEDYNTATLPHENILHFGERQSQDVCCYSRQTTTDSTGYDP